MPYKKPVSVLVLIHTSDLHILLLERATHPGMWQSVTGSQEGEEPLLETALRETKEETGINVAPDALHDWNLVNRFQISSKWRHRYSPDTFWNTEHVFSLELPAPSAVTLSPEEHRAWLWLPWQQAAKKVFSWTNQDAICLLPAHRSRRST